MQQQERKNTRFMSSLKDLKLDNVDKVDFNTQENAADGKRKEKRLFPIKVGIEDQKIYQNFTEINKKKTPADKALILKSLSSHFTLASLIKDNQLKEILLDKFKLCKVNEGIYLINQNDMASSFFILHEGKLGVQINSEKKRDIMPGEGFGQLALLYSAPRSASIKALKNSYLWFIDRVTFRSAVSAIIQKNFKENRGFIDKVEIFKNLTNQQKDNLASICICQHFEKGTKICTEGELASSMYILKSGKILKEFEGCQLGKINAGQTFEEYTALKKNCNRKETLIAEDDCELIAMGNEEIQNALGRSLPVVVLRNNVKKVLKLNGSFENLSQDHIEKIINCFEVKNIGADQTVVAAKSAKKDCIFIVLAGKTSSTSNDGTTLFGGEIFTQNQLANYETKISFQGNGRIAWTNIDKITKELGCSFQEAVQKGLELKKTLATLESKAAAQKETYANMSLQDFEVIKKLGEGQFGTVYLVTTKDRSKFFALKCISKYETLKSKLEKYLLNEKKILETVNSPFVVEHIRSFKDSSNIYFLTEFINGMQLFDAIRIIGLLTADQSRFYISILIQIIAYFHSKGIIYRDLKPENVMVSEDGYVKLIDMGTCKILNQKNAAQKAFTIIGTPNYMAPQILSGKGYSFPADLWSLGVVAYEFMAGYVPFGEDADDPYEIYQEILKNPLSFPKHMSNKTANSFVEVLLNKKPETRLCGSYNELKKHKYLESVDWGQLLKKNVKPCFLPPKNKLININNLQKANTSSLSSILPKQTKALPARKDLDPNWDQSF